LEKILEIVLIGINPGIFEPGHTSSCEQGICTSTGREKCPWYNWGLNRCQKIRIDMKKNK